MTEHLPWNRLRKNRRNNRLNLEKYRKKIEEALERYLPPEAAYPLLIHKAMRYSVFSGGKRIRPLLTLFACQACGGKETDALSAACAIELIHTYSLIHDDLPSMDDDDERRGKPACHKKFGEAIAVLAGDGLQSLAFEILAENSKLEIIREIARASGTQGMVGGQAVDIETTQPHKLPAALQPRGKPLLRDLRYVNSRKTGALITAAIVAGALAANAAAKQAACLRKFGECVGFVFQLVDDMQDNEGYALRLGKEKARREARALTDKAIAKLKNFGQAAAPLRGIAKYLVTRKK